jgi:hypothetical protein
MHSTHHDSQLDTVTPPMLLYTPAPGMLQQERLTTHHFSLDHVMQAHDVLGGVMMEQADDAIGPNSRA